jgi:hypothetical protein
MSARKIQRSILVLTILAMMSTLYGCASAKLNVLKPMTSQPSTASLVILDKTSNKVSAEDIGNLKSAVSNELQKAGVTVVSTEKKDVATIVGQIQEYDKGSQALRYLIGFGAGTGSMKTAWNVTTPNSDELGSCNIDGSISVGVFGGNFYNVHEKAAEAFVKFFNGDDGK